jgi:hypothetical protein
MGIVKKATFFVVPVPLSDNTEVLARGYLPSPFSCFSFLCVAGRSFVYISKGWGMTPNLKKTKRGVFSTDSCSKGVQDRMGNMSSERSTVENQRVL